MKRLTLLASVLLTISATSVQAQSVICEKFGAGQIIANRVCPLGYVKKGEVATTNGGGFGSAGMQAALDMINRNEADRQARLAREAAADGEMPIQFIDFFCSGDAENQDGLCSFRIILLLLRSQKMQTSYC